MLSPIKLLLILPLAVLTITLLMQLRNRRFELVAFVLIAVTGVIFVLAPALTTWFANLLGVGRGADLIFYISIVAGVVAIRAIYSKQRQLEVRQTDIVRILTVVQATKKHRAV